MTSPIRTSILTGFLGSGKTTLIRKLLSAENMQDTAVIVNELGAVGVDHLLYQQVDDLAVVLPNGCVCCAVRSNLVDSILELLQRLESGRVEFRRIVIETSGLAEPSPILAALGREDYLEHRIDIAGVAAVVDATNGLETIARFGESMAQVVCADRILISKCDLEEPSTEFKKELQAYNEDAQLLCTDAADAADLIFSDFRIFGRGARHLRALPQHTAGLATYVLRLSSDMSALSLAKALGRLANEHGHDLLRVKGLVAIDGRIDTPTEIHVVQHALYPPRRLDKWPDGDRTSRLVFIVRRISVETITSFFEAAGILVNCSDEVRA